MSKFKQIQILLKCVQLFAGAKLWKDATASYYWNLVKFAHTHGYLYVGFDRDSIDIAVIAYRVKELNEDIFKNLPNKEEGDTLYVLTIVSKSTDRMKLSKLKHYYLMNNPEVKKIAFHHKGEALKVYEVKREFSQQA